MSESATTDNTSWPRWAPVLIAAAFLFLWVWSRAYSLYPLVFDTPGEPRLSGADSYYHLRHAEYVVEHFPSIHRYDTEANFPNEQRGLNQGGYDLFVATLSKLTFGLLDPLHLMLWLAPLLSGLSLCAVAFALYKKVSPACGSCFLLFSLAYPGPLKSMAALGNGDHHTFEFFLFCSLLLSLAHALRDASPLKAIALPSALLFYFFLSWAGSPVHFMFVGLCFYFSAFLERTPEQRALFIKKGVALGVACSVGPLLVNAVLPEWVIWAKVLTIFVACGAALAIGIGPLTWLAQKLPARFRMMAAFALFLLSPLVFMLSDATWYAFWELIKPRATDIAEQRLVSTEVLFGYYGPTWLGIALTPLLLLRKSNLRPYLVPLVYGVGIVLLWIQTRDFAYYAPVAVAACAAYFIQTLPKKWIAPSAVVLACIAVFSFTPANRPWFDSKVARKFVLYTDGLKQSTDFLSAVREADKSPDKYGLLAPWDLGNILAATSGLPVAFSQTTSVPLANLFYSNDPDGVYETLRESQLRFVLLPTRNLQEKFGNDFALTGRSKVEILSKPVPVRWENISVNVPGFNEKYDELFVPRLFNSLAKNIGHFRLVYESEQEALKATSFDIETNSIQFRSIPLSKEQIEKAKPLLESAGVFMETSHGLLTHASVSPDVRIFEAVPGVVLSGRTLPGQKAVASLQITSPYREKPYTVTWEAVANNRGKFELRLPYANGGPIYDAPGSIVVSEEYVIESLGAQLGFSLTEEQIQSEAKLKLNEISHPIAPPEPPAPPAGGKDTEAAPKAPKS